MIIINNIDQGMCSDDLTGVDLRDTLNRRRDQERSQHSTAQRSSKGLAPKA